MQSAQLWELGCLIHECTEELHDLQTQHRSPCQCTATEESLCFFLNRTIGVCICATTEMSTTLNTNCAPRCTITGMSRTGPRTAPEETRRSAHSLHCGYPSLRNLGHRIAGNCHCMITRTYTTEEEVHDAARPAPPPTQPLPSHHHHRRRLQATACHRLPLLDDGSWSNLLTLPSKRQCWRDHPCHRVHQPSEKALSMMRRSRGRAAQRPRQGKCCCLMFVVFVVCCVLWVVVVVSECVFNVCMSTT